MGLGHFLPASVLLAIGTAIAPDAGAQASITHVQVTIDARNELWTSTPFVVASGDVLVVSAEGEVRIGPYHDPVDANGAAWILFAGALELKIGISPPLRPGSQGCVVADRAGRVWLRVQDLRHDDNDGSFTVRIVHIPAGMIPAPRVIRP